MSFVDINIVNFRAAFSEFSDTAIYPDALIERFIIEAEGFISFRNYGMTPARRTLAVYYIIAHLITLAKIEDGKVIGQNDARPVQSSSIDSVSVALAALPKSVLDNATAAWFYSTPYGQKYWAMMTANTPIVRAIRGASNVFGLR